MCARIGLRVCLAACGIILLAASNVFAAKFVEYEQAADQWMADVGKFEARAFDEFAPGPGGGCLAQPPGTIVQLNLSGGTMSVSSHSASGQPDCAIFDGNGGSSDGYMVGPIGGDTPITLRLEFDPSIRAFYGFYGSLQFERTVTMNLYGANNALIESLEGPLPPNSVYAVGHGFAGDTAIRRIEFVTSEDKGNGITLLGAFAGLAAGEPSLGVVAIPDHGDVLHDFAVVWGAPCPGDIYQPHNGYVNVDDLLVVINLWGQPGAFGGIADVNDDGLVNVDDLLAVINSWGACP